MIKYSSSPGFCKALHYHGLWYVAYEGETGNFHKKEMACTCKKDGCDKDCDVFKDAEDLYPYEKEWRLKENI